MLQNKNYTYWVLAVIIAIAALSAYFLKSPVPQSSTPPSSIELPATGPIVIQGKIVCLPHKNTSGGETMECAFGLKDNQGRYFGLRDTDPTYKNVQNVGMDVPVEVEGTFTPSTESNYKDIGVIDVIRITTLNTENQNNTPSY